MSDVNIYNTPTVKTFIDGLNIQESESIVVIQIGQAPGTQNVGIKVSTRGYDHTRLGELYKALLEVSGK